MACVLVSWQRSTEVALIWVLGSEEAEDFHSSKRPLWGLLEGLLTPTQTHVESLTCGASFQRLRQCQLHRLSICAENTKTSHPIELYLALKCSPSSRYQWHIWFPKRAHQQGILLWCNYSQRTKSGVGCTKKQDFPQPHPWKRWCHLWAPKALTCLSGVHNHELRLLHNSFSLQQPFFSLVLGLARDIYCFQHLKQKIAPRMLVPCDGTAL